MVFRCVLSYIHDRKPKSECGSDTEVYSRIVGYLRPIGQWNDGKRSEFGMPTTFRIGE